MNHLTYHPVDLKLPAGAPNPFTNEPLPDETRVYGPGASLRQHFAGVALQGILASPGAIQPDPQCGWGYANATPADLAREAVKLADALLEELAK